MNAQLPTSDARRQGECTSNILQYAKHAWTQAVAVDDGSDDTFAADTQ